MEASELFENAIVWLRQNYAQFQFFAERDVVWTLQLYLIRQINECNLPYRVFHGYTITFDDRSTKNVDLVILNEKGTVEVAAEFKYEPSHHRKDFLKTKFPVVLWPEAVKDVVGVQNIADQRKASAAYSVLVDEGRHFLYKPLPPGTAWKHWDTDDATSHQASLLWLRLPNQ
ncbi:MAG: hypothetical protein ABI413_09205 [Ktedonobacteraceae bacterium]